MIRGLIGLWLLALAACAAPSGTDRVPLSTTGLIAQANTQISLQRANAGIIRPLIHSPALQAAAQAQADDIAATGQIGHIGRDGSTLGQRVSRAGFEACFAAENTAFGQSDLRSALAAWSASPDHQSNMLNPNATQFGIARAGQAWVLVLGRPC